MKVYLDNAATTAIYPEVIEEICQNMHSVFGNPSSTHQFGRKAKSLVENARKSIAKHLNVSANEIIFTAGGSEADNLILRNAVANLGIERIISSKIEHHAVLHTIFNLKKEYPIEVSYVKLSDKGEVDYKNLEDLLTNSSKKTLVSLMMVNNEIGNLLEVAKVSNLCKNYNAFFHSDTVQGVGHYKIDLKQIPIDFCAASAHKFHGPKGVGFAFVKKGIGIKPLLIGGEQEHGTRAGTENVHSIVGMSKALDIALDHLEEDSLYIKNLKQYFIEQLELHFDNIAFNGLSNNLNRSTYITLNVRFAKEIPMLLFNLDLKGIAVSGGSACQSGSNMGSHVLNEILNKDEARNTSVRFSFSKENTKEEIDYVIAVLRDLIQ